MHKTDFFKVMKVEREQFVKRNTGGGGRTRECSEDDQNTLYIYVYMIYVIIYSILCML
jgi:hypothetical protein